MAVATLDPRTALIVCDMQRGIVVLPTIRPIVEVVARSVALADAFRRHGLPVVLANITGLPPGRTEEVLTLSRLPAGWTDLIPELAPRPEDVVLTREAFSVFAHTDLAQRLASLGVTQVVLVGFATSVAVEATARAAYDLGFNVTLAVDAMTDLNEHAQLNTINRIFPRIGQTGTTKEILELLDRDLPVAPPVQ
jgi:nicotinamidase-related amidase